MQVDLMALQSFNEIIMHKKRWMSADKEHGKTYYVHDVRVKSTWTPCRV